MAPAVTLFSWGYWGWGESTQHFGRAADAVEQSRGFAPPYFVDIRIRRSGRASGFVGDAFARVVGHDRYQWMQSLGNEAIVHRNGEQICIKEPAAAGELLELALQRARDRQRIIFFCACEYPCRGGRSDAIERWLPRWCWTKLAGEPSRLELLNGQGVFRGICSIFRSLIRK